LNGNKNDFNLPIWPLSPQDSWLAWLSKHLCDCKISSCCCHYLIRGD
jgi:hypothetical protein